MLEAVTDIVTFYPWLFVFGVAVLIVSYIWWRYGSFAGRREPTVPPEGFLSLSQMRLKADKIIAGEITVAVTELRTLFVHFWAEVNRSLSFGKGISKEDSMRLEKLQDILNTLQDKEIVTKDLQNGKDHRTEPASELKDLKVNKKLSNKSMRIIMAIIITVFVFFFWFALRGFFSTMSMQTKTITNVHRLYDYAFVGAVTIPLAIFSIFVILGEKKNKKFVRCCAVVAVGYCLLALFSHIAFYNLFFLVLMIMGALYFVE